jgi:hypothetical protein
LWFWPEGELVRELGRRFVLELVEGGLIAGFVVAGVLVEGVEELLLGCCDGLGVERGDLGRGLGLLSGAFGLGGKDRAIAGGVGVTLSDGGCDAAGAGWGGGRGRECERGLRGSAAAAAAVCGEAVCDLAAEGLGGGGRRGGAGRGVGGRGIAGCFGNVQVERGGVKQCGAHFAQNSNSLP